MLALLLLPLNLIAGGRHWWATRGLRLSGAAKFSRSLSAYRLGRSLQRAYEKEWTVRVLVDHLSNYIPLKRRYLYYRNTLHRTVEFRNVWSRGVIGGFVNRNFVGQQPPIRHGTARVSLILHRRKIPLKPRRAHKTPPNVRGGARFRSRTNRSGLGV